MTVRGGSGHSAHSHRAMAGQRNGRGADRRSARALGGSKSASGLCAARSVITLSSLPVRYRGVQRAAIGRESLPGLRRDHMVSRWAQQLRLPPTPTFSTVVDPSFPTPAGYFVLNKEDAHAVRRSGLWRVQRDLVARNRLSRRTARHACSRHRGCSAVFFRRTPHSARGSQSRPPCVSPRRARHIPRPPLLAAPTPDSRCLPPAGVQSRELRKRCYPCRAAGRRRRQPGAPLEDHRAAAVDPTPGHAVSGGDADRPLRDLTMTSPSLGRDCGSKHRAIEQ
jgi:hypothetical protein